VVTAGWSVVLQERAGRDPKAFVCWTGTWNLLVTLADKISQVRQQLQKRQEVAEAGTGL
jgi:hypothetical protein